MGWDGEGKGKGVRGKEKRGTAPPPKDDVYAVTRQRVTSSPQFS